MQHITTITGNTITADLGLPDLAATVFDDIETRFDDICPQKGSQVSSPLHFLAQSLPFATGIAALPDPEGNIRICIKCDPDYKLSNVALRTQAETVFKQFKHRFVTGDDKALYQIAVVCAALPDTAKVILKNEHGIHLHHTPVFNDDGVAVLEADVGGKTLTVNVTHRQAAQAGWSDTFTVYVRSWDN